MRISLYATFLALTFGAGVVSANESAAGWQREANNEIGNLPSLQRGARNFMAYCSGCHSLKFVRYSRVCSDLKIPSQQCEGLLVRPGDKPTDYIKSSMPAKDAADWFGKVKMFAQCFAIGIVLGMRAFELETPFWSATAHAFVWMTLVTSIGSCLSSPRARLSPW